jgi:hypothetical protein
MFARSDIYLRLYARVLAYNFEGPAPKIIFESGPLCCNNCTDCDQGILYNCTIVQIVTRESGGKDFSPPSPPPSPSLPLRPPPPPPPCGPPPPPRGSCSTSGVHPQPTSTKAIYLPKRTHGHRDDLEYPTVCQCTTAVALNQCGLRHSLARSKESS